MDQPLSGVRVLEVAGPCAGRVLADHGAEVEPTGGDVGRTLGPVPDDQPDASQSAPRRAGRRGGGSMTGSPAEALRALDLTVVRTGPWRRRRPGGSSAIELAQAENAPVADEHDATTDPHLRAWRIFRENSSTDAGAHEYPGRLWRWSGPELAWGPIHGMGEDNEDVDNEDVDNEDVDNEDVDKEPLGMDDGQYAALAADGHRSLDDLDAVGSPL